MINARKTANFLLRHTKDGHIDVGPCSRISPEGYPYITIAGNGEKKEGETPSGAIFAETEELLQKAIDKADDLLKDAVRKFVSEKKHISIRQWPQIKTVYKDGGWLVCGTTRLAAK